MTLLIFTAQLNGLIKKAQGRANRHPGKFYQLHCKTWNYGKIEVFKYNDFAFQGTKISYFNTLISIMKVESMTNYSLSRSKIKSADSLNCLPYALGFHLGYFN